MYLLAVALRRLGLAKVPNFAQVQKDQLPQFSSLKSSHSGFHQLIFRVGIVTGYGLDDPGSISGRCKGFLFSIASEGPLSLL